MSKWSEFSKKVDFSNMKKDIEAAKKSNGSGEYKEVTPGTYNVQLSKMEVGECGEKSKNPGAPLLKVDFKILDGEFKKSHLFMNKVLYTERTDEKWNMPKLMAGVLGWLESLDPSEDVGDITFESYEQFEDMVLDIAEDVSDLTYEVDYDPEAFNSIHISDVYE